MAKENERILRGEEMKSDSWYDKIEPEVQDLVRLLHKHGYYTTNSCGHSLEVDGVLGDSDLNTLYHILDGGGYSEFTILINQKKEFIIMLGPDRLTVESIRAVCGILKIRNLSVQVDGQLELSIDELKDFRDKLGKYINRLEHRRSHDNL